MMDKKRANQQASPETFIDQYSRHPTDQEILEAIEAVKPGKLDWYIESLDTVRIAYQYLDAQRKIKSCRNFTPLKHRVESWAGRYISRSACEVAGYMHPEIKGEYPFNLKNRHTWPHPKRLEGIEEAGIHRSTYRLDKYSFQYTEVAK